MDDHLYEVRILRLVSARGASHQIVAAFADLFCLTLPEAESRLSHLPIVARDRLSHEQAQKYRRVLERAGLECEVREQGGVAPPPLDRNPPLPTPQ